MSDYRRYFVPGGTYFLTLVSYRRRPLFAHRANIQRLREAVAWMKRESPFQFLAGVVLPDHMHFLWTLPPGDADYSCQARVGIVSARLGAFQFSTLGRPGTLRKCLGVPLSRGAIAAA